MVEAQLALVEELRMKKQKLSQDFILDSDNEAELSDSTTKKESTSGAKNSISSPSSAPASSDPTFDLSSKRRVSVRKFRSSVLIDIREYYEDRESGEDRPGKKGISLTLDQFEKLKEILPQIDEALSKMN